MSARLVVPCRPRRAWAQPPHNYAHYSARSLLNGIIAERGLPPGRDSMREVALGLGRIAVAEIEVPDMLANLV